jgi:cellulose biosynthesis protein BcsQ
MTGIYLCNPDNYKDFASFVARKVFDYRIITNPAMIDADIETVVTDSAIPLEKFPIDYQISLGVNDKFKTCLNDWDSLEYLLSIHHVSAHQANKYHRLGGAFIKSSQNTLSAKDVLSEIDEVLLSDYKPLKLKFPAVDRKEEVQQELSNDNINEISNLNQITSDEPLYNDSILPKFDDNNSQLSPDEDIQSDNIDRTKLGTVDSVVNEIDVKSDASLVKKLSSDARLTVEDSNPQSHSGLMIPDIPVVRIKVHQRFHVGGHSKTKQNIVLLYGASPICGASTIAYSLAVSLSKTGGNTLLIDLDILKPGLTSAIWKANDINTNDPATCESIFHVPFEKYCSNISLFAKSISFHDYSLQFIGSSNTNDLSLNLSLLAYDYSSYLYYMSQMFDYVVVDVGRFDSHCGYQANLLSSLYCTPYFVYSCNSEHSLGNGMARTKNVPYNLSAILNRCNSTTNPFIIEKDLQRSVISCVPNIHSIHNHLIDKVIDDYTNYDLTSWKQLVSGIGDNYNE